MPVTRPKPSRASKSAPERATDPEAKLVDAQGKQAKRARTLADLVSSSGDSEDEKPSNKAGSKSTVLGPGYLLYGAY